MSFFSNRPSEWEINALIIISAQLHSIQRKLDTLLTASSNVTTEQLAELTNESKVLKIKTDALAEAIEKAKTKGT